MVSILTQKKQLEYRTDHYTVHGSEKVMVDTFLCVCFNPGCFGPSPRVSKKKKKMKVLIRRAKEELGKLKKPGHREATISSCHCASSPFSGRIPRGRR